MSLKYLKSLLFRSARLQQEIDREHQRRWPDWMRLLKLKKLRLVIKDRMAKLMRYKSQPVLQLAKVKLRSSKSGQLKDA